jgi:hypothetical protein
MDSLTIQSVGVNTSALLVSMHLLVVQALKMLLLLRHVQHLHLLQTLTKMLLTQKNLLLLSLLLPQNQHRKPKTFWL